MPSFHNTRTISTAHQIDYGKQRGWRDAKDIIEAALEQGWCWRQAGTSHLRLTPPIKSGIPVGVSGSPSDVHYRRQIIRQMRKSGFIWPWPPEGGTNGHHVTEEKAVTTRTETEAVPEVWRELDNVPGFELSNGGTCRNRNTGKIIKPNSNGFIRLTTHKGRTVEKNVRGLVLAHFGHPPIRNVIPDTAVEHYRSREAGKMIEPLSHSLGDHINQEEIMLKTVEEEIEDTMATSDDGWKPITWVENLVEGYTVNAQGVARNPTGKVLRSSQIGAQLWLSLRRADTGTARTVRLDKTVLNTFGGPPTNEKDAPVHIDGNTKNCAFENLAWPDAVDYVEETVEETEEKVDVPVRELTAEERLMAMPYEDRVLEVLEQVAADQVPIELLDLTVRTYNILHREGLHTSGVIAQKCPNELLELRLFGEASVEEIEGKLSDLGLSLQPNPPEPTQEEVVAEHVKKVVAEAPSFSVPGKTVGEVEAEAEETPQQRKLRKQREKRAAARKATAPKRGTKAKDELEILRVYRHRGVQLTVDAQGLGELSKKGKLSTEEMQAIATMLTRAAEMNAMMGFK